MIPAVNDRELEAVLEAARAAGADSAGYVLVRLPHELKQLFRDWLQAHLPQRAEHVMSLIRQMRGGADYDSAFGRRMRGEGVFAQLIAQRFAKAQKRYGYAEGRGIALDIAQFVPPSPAPGTAADRVKRTADAAQGELF